MITFLAINSIKINTYYCAQSISWYSFDLSKHAFTPSSSQSFFACSKNSWKLEMQQIREHFSIFSIPNLYVLLPPSSLHALYFCRMMDYTFKEKQKTFISKIAVKYTEHMAADSFQYMICNQDCHQNSYQSIHEIYYKYECYPEACKLNF